MVVMTNSTETAIIRTRETCPCGAVFESDKDVTWGSVSAELKGFREAHEPCRRRSAPSPFPLGPIGWDPDPCIGCSPFCDSVACPKRTVVTYSAGSDSGSTSQEAPR